MLRIFNRYLLLCIIPIALLVVTERQLWKVSNMSGRFASNNSGIPDLIEPLVGETTRPLFKKMELEGQLSRTTDRKEYMQLARKLEALLKKIKDKDGQLTLVESIRRAFPDATDTDFPGLTLRLAELYGARGEKEKLEAILLDLLPIRAGTEAPSELAKNDKEARKKYFYAMRTYQRQVKLLQDRLPLAARLASESDLEGFLEQQVYPLCASGKAEGSTTFKIALLLKDYYERIKKPQQEARWTALLKKSTTPGNTMNVVGAIKGKIKNLIKTGKYERIPPLLKSLPTGVDYWPDYDFYDAMTDRPKTKAELDKNRKLWEGVAMTVRPRSDVDIRWREKSYARWSIKSFLNAGRPEDAAYVAKAAALMAPEHGRRMLGYMKSYQWLTSGREGPAPRPLYVIQNISGGAIVIDGKIDEALYRESPPMPGPFYLSNGATRADLHEFTEAKPPFPTIYLFYSSSSFYVCGRLPASQPKPKKNSVDFLLNTEWTKTNRTAISVSLENSENTKVTEAEDGGLVFEACLPLSQLPRKRGARSGQILVGRVHWKKTVPDEKNPEKTVNEVISWNRCSSGYHNVSAWQFLQME